MNVPSSSAQIFNTEHKNNIDKHNSGSFNFSKLMRVIKNNNDLSVIMFIIILAVMLSLITISGATWFLMVWPNIAIPISIISAVMLFATLAYFALKSIYKDYCDQ